MAHDILHNYGHTFVDNSPEEWGKHEKLLYDMTNEIERKMLSAFLDTIGVSTKVPEDGQ